MKVYVKTQTSEYSDYNPLGKLIHYTVTRHIGPFESVPDAVKWTLGSGYEEIEILEFDE